MIESGQQFGLYVVKDVFEASETQACCCAEDPFFNREVTLKTFSIEQFAASHKLEQLESLLERLAVLDHPSIAPIYDSGLEEKSFYYTTACYSGCTLAQRLSGPLADKEALKVTFELTEALEYAHQQAFGPCQLSVDKICFDSEDRAVLVDFGVANVFKQIMTDEDAGAAQDRPEAVAETLRGLGELLLQMLLGPAYDGDARIDDLCAKVINARVRRLVGRFLLPGEWRFASFSELLAELRSFDEVEEQLSSTTEVAEQALPTATAKAPLLEEEQLGEMVADVRRLVAEKNSLQQALDNALYERNLADNKLADEQRKLTQVIQEVAKAKEEANVAWELVAGQKYDRWRPAAWAAGGFLIGFILSGSYGYYYSEQTRNELLAKLQANEELIKTAAWRPAEQEKQPVAQVIAVADEVESAAPAQENISTEEVPESAEEVPPAVVATPVAPVAEEPQQWWPAGSEFSAAAAIPIEQIRVALGFEEREDQTDLPEVLRQEVTATVRRWAESWSRQDLSSYFSVYSENYRPELGRSQQEWRNMRSTRVTRPQWIKLDVDDIRVRQLDDDRIQVKLKQSYRSDFYQDRILKSINLIREDGEWRILMERSLGMINSSDDIVGG